MASAFTLRDRASIYPYPGNLPPQTRTVKGKRVYLNPHLTNPWYRSHARSSTDDDLGGWSIRGCEVEEFPFAALLDDGPEDRVLRLVESEENNAHGHHWNGFLTAVKDWYGRSSPGPSGTYPKRIRYARKKDAIHFDIANAVPGLGLTPQKPIVLCFRATEETPQIVGNWGLGRSGRTRNMCSIPYGVGFLLTRDDPWWDRDFAVAVSWVTWTTGGSTLSTVPAFCNWPAPGPVELTRGVFTTPADAEPFWPVIYPSTLGIQHSLVKSVNRFSKRSCASFPHDHRKATDTTEAPGPAPTGPQTYRAIYRRKVYPRRRDTDIFLYGREAKWNYFEGTRPEDDEMSDSRKASFLSEEDTVANLTSLHISEGDSANKR